MKLAHVLLFIPLLCSATAAPQKVGDRTDYVGTVIRPMSPGGLVTGSEAPGCRTLYGGFSAPMPTGNWEAAIRSFDAHLRKALEEDGCTVFGDSSIITTTSPARVHTSARRGSTSLEIVVWLSPMPKGAMSITYVQCETGL